MQKFRIRYLILALALIMLSSLRCFSKSESVKTGGQWITTRDPAGFSIRHPRGWKVSRSQDTILVKGKDGDVFIQPLMVSRETTPEQIVKTMAQNLERIYPDFMIKGYKKQKESPLQYLLLGQYRKNKTLHAGLFILTLGRDSGIFSGFAAPEREYNKAKSTLVKILTSFELVGGFAPRARHALVYQRVTDPAEGAFSVELPQGWQIQAAIWRPYLDPWVKIDALGRGASVFAKVPHAPIFFVPGYYTTGIYGLREGSPIQPKGASIPGVVYRYLSARDYVNAFLLPQMKGSRVISLKDRPDLVASLKDPQAETASAAEADLTIPSPQGGNPFKGKYLVCTSLVTTSDAGVWMVTIFGYHTYPAEERLASDALCRLLQTLKMNPRWLARQRQEQADRLRLMLAGSRRVSTMIGESYIHSPAPATGSSSSNSDGSRGLIQVLGGKTEVYNPQTGETQTVDIGPGTVWGDAQGDIVRTEDPRLRPGQGYEVLY
ncbi:MAG: hypothetical protein HYU64_17540 [Armatimonadetes bacterium]|nr:hypothetical protein [Armatimonadota bacterium]